MAEKKSYEEELLINWVKFFRMEAEKLSEIDSIAKSLLIAVCYENSTKGYAAEDHLCELLKDRYRDLTEVEFSN